MLKLIGSAFIILASGLFGMKRYSDLYERKRNLCLLRDGAAKIENSLSGMNLPLYDCFLSAGSFFEKAAIKIGGGLLPPDALSEAVGESFYFQKEDKEIIGRFIDGLCAENTSGQIKNASRFIKELDENIKKAENDVKTKGTLFLKGSFLVAAAAVLMII